MRRTCTARCSTTWEVGRHRGGSSSRNCSAETSSSSVPGSPTMAESRSPTRTKRESVAIRPMSGTARTSIPASKDTWPKKRWYMFLPKRSGSLTGDVPAPSLLGIPSFATEWSFLPKSAPVVAARKSASRFGGWCPSPSIAAECGPSPSAVGPRPPWAVCTSTFGIICGRSTPPSE